MIDEASSGGRSAGVGAGVGDHPGKATVAEASGQFDLMPSEIESWLDEDNTGW